MVKKLVAFMRDKKNEDFFYEGFYHTVSIFICLLLIICLIEYVCKEDRNIIKKWAFSSSKKGKS